MGLDTSHDCWHGSYSGFSYWRGAVADAANVAPLPKGDWEPRNYKGWWDVDPADPLFVLLVHSDCDGYIFPDQAEALADRLEKIVTGDEYTDDLTALFVAGLRRAAEEYEVVTFH